MREKREIENEEQFEKSLADRVYLGTLIAIAFVFGLAILLILACCFIKVKTGVWPTWL